MSEWEPVRLGDVTEQVRDAEKVRPGRMYNLLGLRMRGGGVYLRETVDTTTSKAKTLYRATEGQFVYNRMFAWGGSFGLVTSPFDGCHVSNEFPLFRTRPESLNVDFLRLHFQQPSVWSAIDEASTGTTQSRNRWKEALFADYKVALPSVPEQRRIVDVMAAVDAQIVALEEEARHLDGVYRRSALGLLTVGPNDGWERALVDSEAVVTWTRDVPDGWGRATIGQVATVQAGATPARAKQERYFDGGDVPWVKTGDLNEALISNTSECVTSTAFAETSLRLQPVDAVLVAMYGGFGQIGRTARLNCEATTNQAVSTIKDLRADVLPAFLHETLKTGRPKWRLVAASSRKDPNITRQDVLNFDFPLPPVSQQREIVDVLDAIQCSRDAAIDEAGRLRDFRSTLLTALLSQSIEIPESYDNLLATPDLAEVLE